MWGWDCGEFCVWTWSHRSRSDAQMGELSFLGKNMLNNWILGSIISLEWLANNTRIFSSKFAFFSSLRFESFHSLINIKALWTLKCWRISKRNSLDFQRWYLEDNLISLNSPRADSSDVISVRHLRDWRGCEKLKIPLTKFFVELFFLSLRSSNFRNFFLCSFWAFAGERIFN